MSEPVSSSGSGSASGWVRVFGSGSRSRFGFVFGSGFRIRFGTRYPFLTGSCRPSFSFFRLPMTLSYIEVPGTQYLARSSHTGKYEYIPRTRYILRSTVKKSKKQNTKSRRTNRQAARYNAEPYARLIKPLIKTKPKHRVGGEDEKSVNSEMVDLVQQNAAAEGKKNSLHKDRPRNNKYIYLSLIHI